jgi:NAD(P)-dependent dehydrogenase (short-subunit alcohol dehydrogenase family)
MLPDGTVALVTGGAKRVGRAIVLELARSGCHVAIHFWRDREQAEKTVSDVQALGRRARALAGELADASSWPALISETVESFGRLDVLVNNASAFLTETPDTVERFDVDAWEKMFRVNLVAAMGLVHHARPHLAAGGRGRIVNLCDISADRPWPDHLSYCSSKAALLALTKALARALAPSIQVNAVSPGIAVFPESYGPELRRCLVEKVPLRREGSPEEIARTVRFLVESEYITGQNLVVDGGRSVV